MLSSRGELVNLDQLQIDRFHGHAMMAKAKEKIGLSDPIDAYRAQIRLKDAQDSLSRSREALRNAGDRPKNLIGGATGHDDGNDRPADLSTP